MSLNIAQYTEERPDFAAIAAWIPKGASVLDLGCGDGSLLRYLKETRAVRGYGVEISDLDIVSCIANGAKMRSAKKRSSGMPATTSTSRPHTSVDTE